MSAPTNKQLASRHMRRLRTIRQQVLVMANQWEDLDQFCVNTLVELADTLEGTAVDLLPDDGKAVQ